MSVLKKKIFELFSLTSILIAIEKSFRICLKAWASLTMGVARSMLSSTNCWWVKTSPSIVSLSPYIFPYTLAYLIALSSTFIMRLKRKGESGFPCLSPLKGLKVLDGEPFSKIEKLEVVTRTITILSSYGQSHKLSALPWCMPSSAYHKPSLGQAKWS